MATGFLRNSMINEEGGVDPEQFRMEAMYDRMDAIGKGILGVTIQCAQCHDHKYDPIKQEEYYRIFAFLNDTHEANIRGLHSAGAGQAREICAARAGYRSRVAAPHAGLADAHGGVGRAGEATISPSGACCSSRWTISRPAASANCR